MAVQRNITACLAKRLLSLVLLILIVYTTLYFPPSLLKERLTVPVTALLAGAVLLTSINSGLPDIGYTVAIEYAFYVFFLLCLACMVATLIVDRQLSLNRKTLAARANLAMRILYIAVLVILVVGYWHAFGNRLS